MEKSKWDILSVTINASLIAYILYNLVIWGFWGTLFLVAWALL